jgi:hypothetical protein
VDTIDFQNFLKACQIWILSLNIFENRDYICGIIHSRMEFEYLRKLSRLDLELQKELQLKVLEFTVVYEDLLVKEKGVRDVKKNPESSP